MAIASRRGRPRLVFSCEEIEARLCLSGISFASHGIVSAETNGATSVFTADLDGDGDVDVLSASFRDNQVAWHENIDGKGTFGRPNVITNAAGAAQSVYAMDVDGDGDVDVLSASRNDNKIAWYENLDGKGTFGNQVVISTDAMRANSVYAADMDGDGDIDVLSASRSDNTIAWYENTDGNGIFGQRRVIATSAGWSVYAADVDGDGDLDVLSASSESGTVAWYENKNGIGDFGGQRIITTNARRANHVFAADMDGDGDVDVLSAGNTSIAWYENADGTGVFAQKRVVSTAAYGASAAYAADVDGDGDLDVISGSAVPYSFENFSTDNKIAWYENTDGKGSFGPQNLIALVSQPYLYSAVSVYASDIDGDGDLDVLSASPGDSSVAWYENSDGMGSFEKSVVITAAARGATSVYAADVDGDGDLDVLSASYGDHKIAWYENTDGKGSFGPQKVITRAAIGAASVYAADLDGDGDVDVLSASRWDSNVAWYENTNGRGTFSEQRIIATEGGVNSVYAADLDGDGDADVLSASWRDNRAGRLAWYENTDGGEGIGQPQAIINSPVRSVYAADVDGDGDLDVFSAFSSGNNLAWYENTDGKGRFGEQRVITTDAAGATSVYAVDVDGDGDVDVLSAFESSPNVAKVAWYENTDGRGLFSRQKIISTDIDGAVSVYVADLDGDGDIDVLSASARDARIAWYENIDGSGSFGEPQDITTLANGAQSVYAADLDGDGDLDVLSASSTDDKVAWYEQLRAQFAAGDANGDLQFDQQDIVQVLQAAKYLTGERATVEEGDWNVDGVFNQLDIVAALQTGNYLNGPYRPE